LNWRSGSGTAGGVEDFCYEGRLNTAFDNHSKAVDEDDRSSATAETPMLIPKRSLEHSSQPVISRRRFIRRMLIVIGLWLALTAIGLVVGVTGYAKFEGMSLVDAYVNAAMILSGMGPVGELKTTAGKIFAGTYAIFSGLIIIIATGFLLAPIFHRVLHRFHVESTHEED
jgi:hypothetical protein